MRQHHLNLCGNTLRFMMRKHTRVCAGVSDATTNCMTGGQCTRGFAMDMKSDRQLVIDRVKAGDSGRHSRVASFVTDFVRIL